MTRLMPVLPGLYLQSQQYDENIVNTVPVITSLCCSLGHILLLLKQA